MDTSRIRYHLKMLVKWFITLSPVNTVVTRILKPLMCRLPENIYSRIPVSSTVTLRLNEDIEILMQSDGSDSIATLLHWGGTDAFEGSTLKWFTRLLPHSRTVIDVGANTGIYALIAGVQNRQRDVWAFEALPAVHEHLQSNIRLNRLANVHSHALALTNFDGEITLHVQRSVTLPTTASTLDGFRMRTHGITVPARTLDSLVDELAIVNVDLIKVDTEATEHIVLEGATELLKRDEPMIVCEVLKGRTEDALTKLLGNLGYLNFWITDEALIPKEKIEGDPSYRNRDFLFVTERWLAKVHETEKTNNT
jgi:FkbM family methyltransferase